MSVEENKALVRRYMDAVIDGDIDTIVALQHPEVKWWVIGVGEMDGATFNAQVRDGLLAATKRTITLKGIVAEGDRVAYEAEGEMVFPGGVYRNVYHNLLIIRDGLIVEGHEYMDPRAAAEAFPG